MFSHPATLWAKAAGLGPTVYFGTCDSAGNPTGSTGNNDNGPQLWWASYVCPGSGNQTIVEAAVCAHQLNASPDVQGVRMAIYDSAGTTLITYSDKAILRNNTATAYWQACPNIVGTLTGGTTYKVALTWDSAGNGIASIYCGGVNSGSYASPGVEYTASTWPSSLPSSGGNYYMYPVRVGVAQ